MSYQATKTPKEVRCPKCGELIDHLTAFSLEENMQDVTVDNEGDTNLSWDCSEPVECSCIRINFECPNCNATLFSNKGESRDERVIDFLKTGNYHQKEKVIFT